MVKKTLWLFSVIIFLITTSAMILNPDAPLDKDKSYPRQLTVNKRVKTTSERFYLNATTNFSHLFDFGGMYGIANKFNLTIDLDINSSSSLNISRRGISKWYKPEMWDGPIDFLIYPGETQAFTYVSHYCSDTYDHYLSFFAQLTNESAQASGSYHVIELDKGIWAPECGTGHLFVSNITEWLSNRKTATTTSWNQGFGIFVIYGLILIFIPISRKRSQRVQ